MNRAFSFIRSAFALYTDGFRNMTIGRTLWPIILIKLFVIFFILRLFFFPNYLANHAEEGQEADFVANELMKR